jgi:mRNA interferase HigB
MRIITAKRFREFGDIHPDCVGQLEVLRRDLKNQVFENLSQVKDYFPYVSILKNNRVVFNIHGNKYRLVLKFNFKVQVVYVRFIGTHPEYDKIDANNI